MESDSTATDGYWEKSVLTRREYELEQDNLRLRRLLAELYEKYGVSFDAEMIERIEEEVSDGRCNERYSWLLAVQMDDCGKAVGRSED